MSKMNMMDKMSLGGISKINTDPLKMITVTAPKDIIKPVGIVPAVVANGEVVTRTGGTGDGIFSKVVDVAKLVFSNASKATGSALPVPGQIYQTPGINQNAGTGTQGGDSSMNGLLLIGGLVIGKLLKLF